MYSIIGDFSFSAEQFPTIPPIDFAVEDLNKVEQLKSEKIDDQRRIIALQDEIMAEENKLDLVQDSRIRNLTAFISNIKKLFSNVVMSVGEKEKRSKSYSDQSPSRAPRAATRGA